ncbi:TMEM175 family protein [Actinomadura verrucosospora]|uniref:Integral membrane protein n=1 Tax=Actinomadura verrucosospora TaxID=46165 RepID=A0A7D3VRU0_ACTVE|nr:TMEM175 family protein [Actinomadura verrucosospora]QKG20873.1 Integral membrane protein [Actinomadura verrucosospora]
MADDEAAREPDGPADGEAAEGGAGEPVTPERLRAFSDGVFAIAATLLILEVKAPAADERVWHALRHEWPALAAYAVTFLVIGIAWIHHHNLFHQVRTVDRRMLLLNLGMLATISFLPLPTATLGDHLRGGDASAAAVFYAASMAAASGWFTLFWHHLCRRPHLMRPAARDGAPRARRNSLLGPVGYAVAALIAPLTPEGSLALSAAIVLYFVVGRRAPATRTHIPAK